MASRSQGSKSASPTISTNFAGTSRSFAAALTSNLITPQQQQQQQQGPPLTFASTADRDRFLNDNPLSAYVASGSLSVAFPQTLRVGDLPSPDLSARSAPPATGSMSKESILEAKYAALLQSNAERDLASALHQSTEHENLVAKLRIATREKEQLEFKYAELESKSQSYPDNLSDGVPPSVLSIAAPSYPPTNKLLQTAVPLDVLLSVCSEPSNSYAYGDPNSSGMLRTRLMKDAIHFPPQGMQGMQFFFHVLSILPLPINKYLAAQALADPTLKNDPLRLIEYLCYRFSHGFIKSLTSLRAVLPKTVADQAQFMAALAKLDLNGLYGPRLGRLYPAFFIRLGVLGVDVADPDVDYSTLSSGSFTDASFTVVTSRVFAWSRFKDELAFADTLAAFVLSGAFTSSSSLHAISGPSSRDRASRPDGRSRAREASSEDKPSRGRGGRGGRSFSRSRFPSFRQFTFGTKKERMCHSFFEHGSCNKRAHPDHTDSFKHWTKGKSATLDQAFATWKQERSEFEDEQSLRDQSPSPSDDEDHIPDEP